MGGPIKDIEEEIARLERLEIIFKDCPGCASAYEAIRNGKAKPLAPPHKASKHCESGKLNHCTCDYCF